MSDIINLLKSLQIKQYFFAKSPQFYQNKKINLENEINSNFCFCLKFTTNNTASLRRIIKTCKIRKPYKSSGNSTECTAL